MLPGNRKKPLTIPKRLLGYKYASFRIFLNFKCPPVIFSDRVMRQVGLRFVGDMYHLLDSSPELIFEFPYIVLQNKMTTLAHLERACGAWN
jgi:hypothetical protein